MKWKNLKLQAFLLYYPEDAKKKAEGWSQKVPAATDSSLQSQKSIKEARFIFFLVFSSRLVAHRGFISLDGGLLTQLSICGGTQAENVEATNEAQQGC